MLLNVVGNALFWPTHNISRICLIDIKPIDIIRRNGAQTETGDGAVVCRGYPDIGRAEKIAYSASCESVPIGNSFITP